MGKRCGPQGSKISEIIPDEFWVPGSFKTAKFYKACQEHDDCYSRCGASKADCDEAFLRRLKEECDRAYHTILERPLRLPCYAAAEVYYQAVVEFGQGPYEDAQRLACPTGLYTLIAPTGRYIRTNTDLMSNVHQVLDADSAEVFLFESRGCNRCTIRTSAGTYISVNGDSPRYLSQVSQVESNAIFELEAIDHHFALRTSTGKYLTALSNEPWQIEQEDEKSPNGLFILERHE
jgi:hypothetical protein